MFRFHNHAGLIAGALVAASITLAATASTAMPRYDGLWSVSIMTKKGDCIASYRYPMRIANGVLANGGDIAIDVRGKVGANGAVTAPLAQASVPVSTAVKARALTARPQVLFMLLLPKHEKTFQPNRG